MVSGAVNGIAILLMLLDEIQRLRRHQIDQRQEFDDNLMEGTIGKTIKSVHQS